MEWSVARDGGRFDNGWKREEYLVSKVWIAGMVCVKGKGSGVSESR